jgi:hypothetical protein
MENPQLYIVRYYDPALSYLPKIGSLLHEKMKAYNNHLIRYDDIDKLVAQLVLAQCTIIAQNPRLKRIRIDWHNEHGRVIIDTPVKNDDPEILFIVEPVAGYLNDCLSIDYGTKGKTADIVIKTILQRLDVLRMRKSQMDIDIARSPVGFGSTDATIHAKTTAQVACMEDLLEILKGNEEVTK